MKHNILIGIFFVNVMAWYVAIDVVQTNQQRELEETVDNGKHCVAFVKEFNRKRQQVIEDYDRADKEAGEYQGGFSR